MRKGIMCLWVIGVQVVNVSISMGGLFWGESMEWKEDLRLRTTTFQTLMVRQKKIKWWNRLERVVRGMRRKPRENKILGVFHLSFHPSLWHSVLWEAHFCKLYHPASPAPWLDVELIQWEKREQIYFPGSLRVTLSFYSGFILLMSALSVLGWVEEYIKSKKRDRDRVYIDLLVSLKAPFCVA